MDINNNQGNSINGGNKLEPKTDTVTRGTTVPSTLKSGSNKSKLTDGNPFKQKHKYSIFGEKADNELANSWDKMMGSAKKVIDNHKNVENKLSKMGFGPDKEDDIKKMKDANIDPNKKFINADDLKKLSSKNLPNTTLPLKDRYNAWMKYNSKGADDNVEAWNKEYGDITERMNFKDDKEKQDWLDRSSRYMGEPEFEKLTDEIFARGEKPNQYTKQELFDKFGTDNVDLINAGRENPVELKPEQENNISPETEKKLGDMGFEPDEEEEMENLYPDADEDDDKDAVYDTKNPEKYLHGNHSFIIERKSKNLSEPVYFKADVDNGKVLRFSNVRRGDNVFKGDVPISMEDFRKLFPKKDGEVQYVNGQKYIWNEKEQRRVPVND